MTSSAKNRPLKVVLLHDWLTGFRGGERVLESLCELFPEAPIYTLIHEKGSTSPTIESREIVTSVLNRIPGIHRSYRKFLPLMPWAAAQLHIRHEADVIISSSHCVIKGVTRPNGAKHLSYVHSPMRYIYDQFDSYFGHSSAVVKLGAHFCRPFLKVWDRQSNRNVHRMIANSHFVAERIRTFYGIDAGVVHPFVDLLDFRPWQQVPIPKENFYLMVTAFAPNKRVDLAIRAFQQLPTARLKIVGTGAVDETIRLKQMAGVNVEFLGNVSREEIIKLMNQARAFVFPGVEDFGITPLESLAAGTPVIAYHAGGVLETLTPETAAFFHDATPDALRDAIETFDPKRFNRVALWARAEQFSKERFKERILAEVAAL